VAPNQNLTLWWTGASEEPKADGLRSFAPETDSDAGHTERNARRAREVYDQEAMFAAYRHLYRGLSTVAA